MFSRRPRNLRAHIWRWEQQRLGTGSNSNAATSPSDLRMHRACMSIPPRDYMRSGNAATTSSSGGDADNDTGNGAVWLPDAESENENDAHAHASELELLDVSEIEEMFVLPRHPSSDAPPHAGLPPALARDDGASGRASSDEAPDEARRTSTGATTHHQHEQQQQQQQQHTVPRRHSGDAPENQPAPVQPPPAVRDNAGTSAGTSEPPPPPPPPPANGWQSPFHWLDLRTLVSHASSADTTANATQITRVRTQDAGVPTSPPDTHMHDLLANLGQARRRLRRVSRSSGLSEGNERQNPPFVAQEPLSREDFRVRLNFLIGQGAAETLGDMLRPPSPGTRNPASVLPFGSRIAASTALRASLRTSAPPPRVTGVAYNPEAAWTFTTVHGVDSDGVPMKALEEPARNQPDLGDRLRALDLANPHHARAFEHGLLRLERKTIRRFNNLDGCAQERVTMATCTDPDFLMGTIDDRGKAILCRPAPLLAWEQKGVQRQLDAAGDAALCTVLTLAQRRSNAVILEEKLRVEEQNSATTFRDAGLVVDPDSAEPTATPTEPNPESFSPSRPAADEASSLFEAAQCVVCLSETVSTRLEPCGHQVACTACVKHIIAACSNSWRSATQEGTCPMCRSTFGAYTQSDRFGCGGTFDKAGVATGAWSYRAGDIIHTVDRRRPRRNASVPMPSPSPLPPPPPPPPPPNVGFAGLWIYDDGSDGDAVTIDTASPAPRTNSPSTSTSPVPAAVGDLPEGCPSGVLRIQTATHPYAAEDEDELELQLTDVVYVLPPPMHPDPEDDDDGWLYGWSNGRLGFFPENFTAPA